MELQDAVSDEVSALTNHVNILYHTHSFACFPLVEGFSASHQEQVVPLHPMDHAAQIT
jgi:hypothetical protein